MSEPITRSQLVAVIRAELLRQGEEDHWHMVDWSREGGPRNQGDPNSVHFMLEGEIDLALIADRIADAIHGKDVTR